MHPWQQAAAAPWGPLSNLPAEVTIYEVGPRDGLQNEATRIPTDVKVQLLDMLGAKAGGPSSTAAQSSVHCFHGIL